ncbi:type II secretion system protein N [Uliginosibacterium sp. TH139]|uniref:type II secretion system protein N n=1 Tax=Uliginosibacterium sp. TH139 TaxID=2067453 RepID=UPI000C7D0F39|nr:type II secretion system protein N [Uliginosibacterium sp. TH139]PLK50002.1 hypothetical protein C0V76_06240 [Uliginosibacterium sp. TH139]
MKKPLTWILLALALSLLLLVARFPAGLAARFLPTDIALAGLEGSLWQGRATALGYKGIVAQQKLAWQFQPAALFKGQLAWTLQSEHAGRPGKLRAVLGFRGPVIEGLELSLPLEPLTQFNPTLAGVRLRGDLFVQSERLTRGEPINVSGRIERVSSAMAGEVTSLGSYQFRVTANAAGAGAIELSHLSGTLHAQGGGSFDLAKNKAKLNLRFKPEADLPGLSPVLATLPRDGDSYLLSYPR